MVSMMMRKKAILMTEPHLVSASGYALDVGSTEYAPMKSCVVGIEPLYPWGGDIHQYIGKTVSGWDTLKIYFSTRNIVPADLMMRAGTVILDTGIMATDAFYKCALQYIPVEPSTTYTVQCNKTSSDGSAFTVPFYTQEKTFISRAVAYQRTTETGVITGSFVTPSNAAFIKFSVGASNNSIQIEKGTVATAYENPSDVSISLGQTVYGGTLNILTGELLVDRIHKTIYNTVGLVQMTGVTNRYFYADGFEPYGSIVDDDVISDEYVAQPSIGGANTTIGIRFWNRSASGTVRFLVRPNGYADYTAETYNNYLAENPFNIVYRLRNPRTYMIDPVSINTMRGKNIITTNVGGSLTASVWVH